jgi:hypothetical protein
MVGNPHLYPLPFIRERKGEGRSPLARGRIGWWCIFLERERNGVWGSPLKRERIWDNETHFATATETITES